MKNKISFALLSFIVVAVALVAVPNFSYAATVTELQEQIDSLLAQIQMMQSQINSFQSVTPVSSSSCSNLSYDLYKGIKDSASGGQVTELQKFLAADPSVYPEGLITGYYGTLTEKAVQRWQAKNNVVSSGSPDTTGYGVVGPKTRAKIKEVCGSVSSLSSIAVFLPENEEAWVKGDAYQVRWQNNTGLSWNFADIWLVSGQTPALYTLIASSRSMLSSGVVRLSGRSPSSFLYLPSKNLSDGSYRIRVCYSMSQTINQTQNCGTSAPVKVVSTYPKLSVSTVPMSDSVAAAGSSGFVFEKYLMDTSRAAEDIKLLSMSFEYEDNGYQTSLSNCSLYGNSARLNNGIIPSRGKGVLQILELNSVFVIPKGTSTELELKCDIASWVLESPSYRWTLSDVSAVGGVSGSPAVIDMAGVGSGSKVGIAEPITFLISLASTSPVSGSIQRDEDVVVGIFEFTVSGDPLSESIQIYSIPVVFYGDKSDLSEVSVWDGETRLGLASSSDYLSNKMFFNLFWSVPAGASKILTIKAHASPTAVKGHTARLGIDAKNTLGIGAFSGTQVVGAPGNIIYGAALTITD